MDLPARLTAWHTLAMQERSSKPKRPRDVNQLAAWIVQQSTGEGEPALPEDTRDPAAVSLGRRGGLKGGKARAEKLTPEERSEIARKAAASRWSNRAVKEAAVSEPG